jgi:hypothetical protein
MAFPASRQTSGPGRRSSSTGLDLASSSLRSSLDGQVPVRHPAHLGQELVGQDRDVGLLQAGGREDVDHLVRGHRLRHDLPDGVVQVLRACRRRSTLTRADRTAWKNATSSRIPAPRRGAPPGQTPWTAPVTALSRRFLPSSCCQHVLLGRGQQRQPLPGRPAGPGRPVEAVEDAAADLVLLQHHGDGLFLVDGRLAPAAALGVVASACFSSSARPR